jgi:t-SNARE complex subunit (syntaxin)
MSINKMDIVAGYKGIMDLDLTNVREELKKELAKQHQKDIDDYKSEQLKLEPRLRYENTIERIQNIHKKDKMCQKKRIEQQNEQQMKHINIYNQKRDYTSL